MPIKLQGASAKLWLLGGLFILLFFLAPSAQATHIRAGNIFAKSDTVANPNPLRFYYKLVTYTVLGGIEDEKARLYFGDCTSLEVDRASRTVLQSNGQNNTLVNVYYFEHTYAGPGTFTVTYVGENRNTGIVNISNSVQQTFFIQTTVTIDPFLGVNRSPILEIPPIDIAARNQVFIHNPGAYDPDGDSLSFRLLPSRIFGGQNACGEPIAQTAPGFRNLDQFLGTPVDSPSPFFTLNSRTGQMTWNTPSTTGEFNVAFIVEEYRNGRLIGTVIRDMQIFVREVNNRPPKLIIPRDTCIIAGTLLRDTVTARDPDKHPVLITAFGEVFSLSPNRATFRQNTDTTGVFSWQTTCADVQRSPYQVTFRAEDQPPTGIAKLVDLQPWLITVVGPPPVLTAAVPQSSNSIRLNWQAYSCPNASRIFIYRKEGPSDFVPDACETGIPASAGYTLVGEVTANQITFLDNNSGRGLDRNKTYCYRIYAEFPAPGGGSSIASNEVCASLESISLTKVSVLETSATAGRMRVEWSKPGSIVTQLTAPFSYRLLRAEGQSRAATQAYTPVYTTTNLNDTTFTDSNLNTLDTAYTYKVEFYHSGTTGSPTVLVDSSSASSVWLNAVANGTSLVLNWSYNVPWNNASTAAAPLYHVIYLQRPGNAFVKFDSVLATATTGTFTREIPLLQGQQYCAYVVTKGTFQNPVLPNPVLNNSQIACVVNVCQPILTVDECDQNNVPTGPPFQNVLTWRMPDGCSSTNIASFTLYFKPNLEAPFEVIATLPGTQFSYTHTNLNSFAGCYVITATDVDGNTSVYTDENVVCKENCILFSLPNIFTPNGDGVNDVFTPKQGAAFIRAATLRVYNRWGNKVYEGSADPGLNWRGVDDGGKALSDGTYFYQVDVEFYGLTATPEKNTYKGWVEIIH